jgi:hypothetical protein
MTSGKEGFYWSDEIIGWDRPLSGIETIRIMDQARWVHSVLPTVDSRDGECEAPPAELTGLLKENRGARI